jgi:hypothetical protein
MKKKPAPLELPPIKPVPNAEFYDICVCFGRGARYDYKGEPVTIVSCDRCDGTGYHIRTHAHDVRCPGEFPDYCSTCGCQCYDCKRTRETTPRWSEFEEKLKEHQGNGYPGKFIAWGTEPFRLQNGGIWRIAILQPWPTAGLVWHVCSVNAGRVETIASPHYRSGGAFYGDDFATAIEHAKASAVEKMQRIPN